MAAVHTLFLILLVLAAPLSAAAAGEKVKLSTNSWEPFVMLDGPDRGIISDIIVAAFAEADVDVELVIRPWERGLMLVEEGVYLGAFPYNANETREQFALFSDDIWLSRNVFFYKADRFPDYDFVGFDDLRQRKIAGTLGNSYIEIFKAEGIELDLAANEVSGLRKIREGRAALFVEQESVGWRLIKKHFPDSSHEFRSTRTAWRTVPLNLMISKKYPGAASFLQRFNAGLKTIRENGTYDRIVKKYMGLLP